MTTCELTLYDKDSQSISHFKRRIANTIPCPIPATFMVNGVFVCGKHVVRVLKFELANTPVATVSLADA